jgi:hypothetical protein
MYLIVIKNNLNGPDFVIRVLKHYTNFTAVFYHATRYVHVCNPSADLLYERKSCFLQDLVHPDVTMKHSERNMCSRAESHMELPTMHMSSQLDLNCTFINCDIWHFWSTFPCPPLEIDSFGLVETVGRSSILKATNKYQPCSSKEEE